MNLRRQMLKGKKRNSLIAVAEVRENLEVADDGFTESIEHVTELSVSSATVSTWRVMLLCWFSDSVIIAGSDVIRGGWKMKKIYLQPVDLFYD